MCFHYFACVTQQTLHIKREEIWFSERSSQKYWRCLAGRGEKVSTLRLRLRIVVIVEERKKWKIKTYGKIASVIVHYEYDDFRSSKSDPFSPTSSNNETLETNSNTLKRAKSEPNHEYVSLNFTLVYRRLPLQLQVLCNRTFLHFSASRFPINDEKPSKRRFSDCNQNVERSAECL